MEQNTQTQITARTVTAKGGKSNIFVTSAGLGDKIPDQFLLQAAEMEFGIRLVGGCKGMNKEMREALLPYFVTGFDGIRNVVLTSGGTRHLHDDDSLDAMVTDVPGAIRDAYPKITSIVTLGTTPKAGQLALIKEARFGLADKYGGFNDANPSFDANLIVQEDATAISGWDGDLDIYEKMMTTWAKVGIKVGMVVLNGGDVTAKEIEMALRNDWPLILIDDGIKDRESAKWADKFRAEGIPKNVFIADFSSPWTLTEGLMRLGFIHNW